MVQVQHVEISGSEKTAHLVDELHGRGITYQAIANRLGVNWRTVYRWSRREHPPLMTTTINMVLSQMLAEEMMSDGLP